MQKMKAMIDACHAGKDDGQGFYHYPHSEYLDPDFLK
jgi:3-hydroxybutyryl-CoA dehydrogenase